MVVTETNELHDGLVLRSIVDDLVPEHVSHNYPGMMHALKVYCDFLEHTNNSGHYLNTIDIQRDIDRIESNLLQQLQKEVGVAIPRTFAADPRHLYKRLTAYYRSRGTPESIKDFFQILFNDEVELYFPKDDMLVPSDGKWYDRSIDTIAHPENYAALFTFTLGSSSTTVAGLDDNSRKLIYDNPIIFVNDVHRTDFKSNVVVNTATNVLDYSFEFDTELQAGDVIKVYRSGSFSTNDGFLDNYKKIQDSFFYQKFSYVLRTGTNADDWKNPFARLVHPAGFIFFGEILLFLDNLGNTFPVLQPGLQRGGLAFPIVITPVDASPSFVKTLDNVVASMITVSFRPETSTEVFGSAQHFDQLKFRYTNRIEEYSEITVQDIINNKVQYNIDSFIEIE
jgi:hypothetical protein